MRVRVAWNLLIYPPNLPWVHVTCPQHWEAALDHTAQCCPPKACVLGREPAGSVRAPG